MDKPKKVVTVKDWGRLIANAWLDPNFAEQLRTDPTKAAKQFFDIPEGDYAHVLPIPERPKDMADEAIERMRSGGEIFHPMLCG